MSLIKGLISGLMSKGAARDERKRSGDNDRRRKSRWELRGVLDGFLRDDDVATEALWSDCSGEDG